MGDSLRMAGGTALPTLSRMPIGRSNLRKNGQLQTPTPGLNAKCKATTRGNPKFPSC